MANDHKPDTESFPASDAKIGADPKVARETCSPGPYDVTVVVLSPDEVRRLMQRLKARIRKTLDAKGLAVQRIEAADLFDPR